MSLLAIGVSSAAPQASGAPIRVEGIGGVAPDRIAIFTVRGAGISTPLIAFQDRARRLLEAHMHAEIVSLHETLSRGGVDLNRQLVACQADPKCYADLLGRLDARYLLVLSATRVEDLRLAGARLIDLRDLRILGESIEEVRADRTLLDALDARIQACVPAARWDPFGLLEIRADQAGAQIAVQGRIVGLSPVPRIGYLMPTTYEVTARKAGFETARARATVEQGGIAQVDLTLHPVPEPSSSSTWIWVGAGAAVVVAATVATVLVVSSGGGDPSFCSSPDPAACM